MPDPGQVEFSRSELIPVIDERNRVLFKARLSNDPTLKQKCIDARNNVKDAIKCAKSRWIVSLADRINNMNRTPKDAWKAIGILKNGFNIIIEILYWQYEV